MASSFLAAAECQHPRKLPCFPGGTDGIRGSAGKTEGLAAMQDQLQNTEVEDHLAIPLAQTVCVLLPGIIKRLLDKEEQITSDNQVQENV